MKMSRSRKILRRSARTLAAGGLAGCCALAADQLLAVLTLGFPVPLTPRYGLAYAALGAAGAAACAAGAALLRRRADGWTLFALAAAAVYAPAIFERVHHAFGHRLGPVLAVLAAMLAVAGYGLWIGAMGWIAGARARSLAPGLGAAAAAAGLAINRNLVDYPLEPAALAADAAVLATALALVWLARAAGPRRALAATAAVVLGAAVVTTAGRWQTPEAIDGIDRAPNLVLVVLDTLRQDVFQEVVSQTEEGQAFQRAMDGAAWFSHAIASSPWTVPSVGSIMTGLYPREHGFQAAPVKEPSRPLTPLAESVPTLAQELQRQGYWTEAIGTNPLLQPISGIDRGFERYEILSGPTVKLPPMTALARFGWLRRDYYQQASSVRRRLRQRLAPMTASGRPVFLWLHLMDPHSPLKRHRGLAPDPEAPELDGRLRLYRDETRYTLRELTRMLELLRAHDLWQDTVLVVVSDHGEMFPADGHDAGVTTLGGNTPKLYGHGHAMYGELVRVPLVIRPPGGLGADRQVEALTSHVDLYDTILDLLGAGGPRPGGDRVSLVPWLRAESPGPESPARGHALIGANQHGPRQRALRWGPVKLIEYPGDRRRASELYLLDSDPGERHDAAASEADRLAAARRLLERSWSQLGEPPEAEPAELDAETLERLKALGYVP